MSKALFMDELIRKHSTIMDKYDPDKTDRPDRRRVGYVVQSRTWHESWLPVSAEYDARRSGRLSRWTSSTTTATAYAWPTLRRP